MLCERLDGRTRILLKKQGVYDIMSVSEPEACLHGYGERRMSIMNEVHDIITSKNGLCSVFAILSFSLRICMVLDTLAN